MRGVNSVRWSQNATERAQKCLFLFFFMGNKGSSGSKILWIRVPYFFLYGRVLWENWVDFGSKSGQEGGEDRVGVGGGGHQVEVAL